MSIARKLPYGRDIIINSIKDYMNFINISVDDEEIKKNTIFVDNYIDDGYGKANKNVIRIIKDTLIKYGIPLDTTYTGKAFYGMKEYLSKNDIKNKNVLFIHTGGTPLFFNDLEKIGKD